MLVTGEWIVPHLNGEVYPEKPPLYFWLVALLSKLGGEVTESTARIPSATAATLIVLLTYFLGRGLMGRDEAFWGALITATSAQFFVNAREGALDALLALSILASLSLFYVGYAKSKPALYLAGFLFITPAVLTKGPVGFAIPPLVMLVFLVVEILFRGVPARKQIWWFIGAAAFGLLLVAAMVAPWWFSAYQRSGGAYASLSILTKQTLGRMIESYSHQRPWHYYLGEIWWQFFPWSVFLPLAAYRLKKNGYLRTNGGLRFILVWFLTVFLFFTFVSGKRSQYLMPLLPAGGLILGWTLVNANPGEGRLRERKAFSIPLALAALVSGAGVAVIVLYVYHHANRSIISAVPPVAVFWAILVTASLVCRDRPPKTALACVIATTVLAVVYVYGHLSPVADDFMSARPFCSDVLAASGKSDSIAFYRTYRPNIHFYMNRTIPRVDTEGGLRQALETTDRLLVILQAREQDSLIRDVQCKLETIAQAKIGSREMVCLALWR